MKKIIIILLIIVIASGGAIYYLNKVLLPTKIKALIVDELSKVTKKRVTLGALQFNLFKGLLLKDLVIADNENTLLELKEGSCVFLIMPIFKKTLIIPSVSLKSPRIYLERRKDKSFNIEDLFPKQHADTKGGFNVIVYNVNINNATIRFQDNSLLRPFSKDIEKLDLNLSLSLPASVKFNLVLANMKANGEYKIPKEELTAKISMQNISLKEYAAYYQDMGISVPESQVDSVVTLRFKDKVFNIVVEAKDKNLNIISEKVSARLNSEIQARIQYGLKENQVKFSGSAKLINSTVSISGLELIDKINNVNGRIVFDNSGISTENLNAHLLGVPVKAQASIKDFQRPVIEVNISAAAELEFLQKVLKEKFRFDLPGQAQGSGNISVKMQAEFLPLPSVRVGGYIDLAGGVLKLDKFPSPVEGMAGRVEFNLEGLSWSELAFKYGGIDYKSKGSLLNFSVPNVNLELSSKDLSLESNFVVSNKLIKIAKLAGRYSNSGFSLSGNINTANIPELETSINGNFSLDLEDLKKILSGSAAALEKIKPQGLISGQFSLSGDLNNWKSCAIQAKLTGPQVSLYGLKGKDFLLSYGQQDGIAEISTAHLALYDGTMDLGAKMNLKSQNLPYWIDADIRAVKLEQLKEDIPIKEKKISGSLSGHAKLNGYYNDISLLNGAGNIVINEGRLWELDLFKGLGSLIFVKDFSEIVFHEASCGFLIKDKYIFTDTLKLKSNIVNLAGSVKVGFDSSLDSSLNVEVLSDLVPLSGTFKDVTTAIMGAAEKFAVIKITGTLKEPKYTFKPAVTDIIKGIKDIFFRK